MTLAPSVAATPLVSIGMALLTTVPGRARRAAPRGGSRPVVAEPTDAALAASAVGGDTRAFEAIMRRHYEAVWRVAFLSVREEAAAEELAQDTFLRAHGALAGWRGDASLRTWLATICRRLCIDRARRKHLETVGTGDLETFEGGSSRIETLADRFDLRAALDRLPADDREAFLLVHHDGYSSFEAATILGVPASTIRSRVGRARQRLADEITGRPLKAQEEESA